MARLQRHSDDRDEKLRDLVRNLEIRDDRVKVQFRQLREELEASKCRCGDKENVPSSSSSSDVSSYHLAPRTPGEPAEEVVEPLFSRV